MDLPLSTAIADRLEYLDETGSTNAVLAERARQGGARSFDVVVTTSQTAGRGRLGRTWVAPPGTTIAVSVLLAPAPERLPWVPLLAGLAMARAVRPLVGEHVVSLKWPNDVQVDGLKVSGILAELVPGAGVVLGAGLNLTMGADPDGIVDRALAAYLRELRAAMDLRPEDARAAVERECSTLGRRVRVELPGGDDLYGTATAVDADGRLVVDGRAIAAGDVTHLRYE